MLTGPVPETLLALLLFPTFIVEERRLVSNTIGKQRGGMVIHRLRYKIEAIRCTYALMPSTYVNKFSTVEQTGVKKVIRLKVN